MKYCSASEAIQKIPQTGNVFIHGGCATPKALIEELVHQAPRFDKVNLIHLHTTGEAPYSKDEYRSNFRTINLFVGSNIRGCLNYDTVDYLPCFLSEMPALFRKKVLNIDAALIQVSQPDKHGYCSLGTSVDIARAAVDMGKLIIAQINSNMPRTHGDGMIHESSIHYAVELNEALHEAVYSEPTAVEQSIGHKVAELVEDGSTLQVGIGAIPDAVLMSLHGHKDLGIHTEMWSDGVIPLMKQGIINNKFKKIHKGKSVAAFMVGSKRLFDFVDDNPAISVLDVAYVNNPTVIAKNPKVVAINSAVEIDLTGQVCADSIGTKIISGVGGQMDFIRGASLSEGGKPIIAIASRSKKGFPRIVPMLRPGAGVVTTRAHVHYVVTEYGIADLYGKTLSQRAKALIAIAHPEDRDPLSKSWQSMTSKC